MRDLATGLAHSPVFGALSEPERAQLAGLAVHRKYARDEQIAPYGEKWPYLFMVAKGEVHALKESREGRSLIVMMLGAEDIFWGTGFFIEGAPMPVLLEAHTATKLYLWPRETVVPWLQMNGPATWNLMTLMVRRMMRASDIVEELAFQPVKGRLARMLLSLYGDAANEFVPRDLTLDEMAALIGTKREMVCRLLYEFAEEGAIEIKRTEFMIADRDKLERFTQQARG